MSYSFRIHIACYNHENEARAVILVFFHHFVLFLGIHFALEAWMYFSYIFYLFRSILVIFQYKRYRAVCCYRTPSFKLNLSVKLTCKHTKKNRRRKISIHLQLSIFTEGWSGGPTSLIKIILFINFSILIVSRTSWWKLIHESIWGHYHLLMAFWRQNLP